jgi:hypothetical protein
VSPSWGQRSPRGGDGEGRSDIGPLVHICPPIQELTDDVGEAREAGAVKRCCSTLLEVRRRGRE